MAHYQQGRRQQMDEYGNPVPGGHGVQGQQLGESAGGYGVAGTGSYGGQQQAGYGPTGTGTHDAGGYGGSGHPGYGVTGTGVHDAGGPGAYGAATGTRAHDTHGGVTGIQDGAAGLTGGGLHGATGMGTTAGTGAHGATGMLDTGVLGGGGHAATGMPAGHGTRPGATSVAGTGGAFPHAAEHKTGGGILRRSGSSSSSSSSVRFVAPSQYSRPPISTPTPCMCMQYLVVACSLHAVI
jgi:hypothetical protein